MYSNVDVLRNFISNLPLFGNILNVFDRFNRLIDSHLVSIQIIKFA